MEGEQEKETGAYPVPHDLSSSIQIGTLVLRSPICSMNELYKLLVKMLSNPEIKKLLEFEEQKTGGYFG